MASIINYNEEEEAEAEGEDFISGMSRVSMLSQEHKEAVEKGPIAVKAFFQSSYIWEGLEKELKPRIVKLAKPTLKKATELFDGLMELGDEECKEIVSKGQVDKARLRPESLKRRIEAKEKEQSTNDLDLIRWETDGGARMEERSMAIPGNRDRRKLSGATRPAQGPAGAEPETTQAQPEAAPNEPSPIAIHNQKLITRIRENGGRITFEEFQRIAASEGYYKEGLARFGASSTDGITFKTDASGCSARAFARQFYGFWEEMGRPDIFNIVEQGGGDESMALHILDAIQAEEEMRDFYEHIRYTILDISKDWSRKQEQLLHGPHPGVRCIVGSVFEMPFENESVEGVFFSNELPDAFPVHRVVVRGGILKEIYVTYDKGEFKEEEADLSTDEINKYFELVGKLPPEGKEIAVNLHLFTWMEEVNRVLKRGFVVTSDYSFEKTQTRYDSAHREAVWNLTENSRLPILTPCIDITHNVDFETLDKIARSFGLAHEHSGSFETFLMLFAPGAIPVNREEYILIHSKRMKNNGGAALSAVSGKPVMPGSIAGKEWWACLIISPLIEEAARSYSFSQGGWTLFLITSLILLSAHWLIPWNRAQYREMYKEAHDGKEPSLGEMLTGVLLVPVVMTCSLIVLTWIHPDVRGLSLFGALLRGHILENIFIKCWNAACPKDALMPANLVPDTQRSPDNRRPYTDKEVYEKFCADRECPRSFWDNISDPTIRLLIDDLVLRLNRKGISVTAEELRDAHFHKMVFDTAKGGVKSLQPLVFYVRSQLIDKATKEYGIKREDALILITVDDAIREIKRRAGYPHRPMPIGDSIAKGPRWKASDTDDPDDISRNVPELASWSPNVNSITVRLTDRSRRYLYDMVRKGKTSAVLALRAVYYEPMMKVARVRYGAQVADDLEAYLSDEITTWIKRYAMRRLDMPPSEKSGIADVLPEDRAKQISFYTFLVARIPELLQRLSPKLYGQEASMTGYSEYANGRDTLTVRSLAPKGNWLNIIGYPVHELSHLVAYLIVHPLTGWWNAAMNWKNILRGIREGRFPLPRGETGWRGAAIAYAGPCGSAIICITASIMAVASAYFSANAIVDLFLNDSNPSYLKALSLAALTVFSTLIAVAADRDADYNLFRYRNNKDSDFSMAEKALSGEPIYELKTTAPGAGSDSDVVEYVLNWIENDSRLNLGYRYTLMGAFAQIARRASPGIYALLSSARAGIRDASTARFYLNNDSHITGIRLSAGEAEYIADIMMYFIDKTPITIEQKNPANYISTISAMIDAAKRFNEKVTDPNVLNKSHRADFQFKGRKVYAVAERHTDPHAIEVLEEIAGEMAKDHPNFVDEARQGRWLFILEAGQAAYRKELVWQGPGGIVSGIARVFGITVTDAVRNVNHWVVMERIIARGLETNSFTREDAIGYFVGVHAKKFTVNALEFGIGEALNVWSGTGLTFDDLYDAYIAFHSQEKEQVEGKDKEIAKVAYAVQDEMTREAFDRIVAEHPSAENILLVGGHYHVDDLADWAKSKTEEKGIAPHETGPADALHTYGPRIRILSAISYPIHELSHLFAYILFHPIKGFWYVLTKPDVIWKNIWEGKFVLPEGETVKGWSGAFIAKAGTRGSSIMATVSLFLAGLSSLCNTIAVHDIFSSSPDASYFKVILLTAAVVFSTITAIATGLDMEFNILYREREDSDTSMAKKALRGKAIYELRTQAPGEDEELIYRDEKGFDLLRRWIDRQRRNKKFDLERWAEEEAASDEDRDNLANALVVIGLSEEEVRALLKRITLVTIPAELEEQKRLFERMTNTKMRGGIVRLKAGPRILFLKDLITGQNDPGNLQYLLHEVVELELLESGMKFHDAHWHAKRVQKAWKTAWDAEPDPGEKVKAAAGAANKLMYQLRNPHHAGVIELKFEDIIKKNLTRMYGLIDTEDEAWKNIDLSHIEQNDLEKIVREFIESMEKAGWHDSPGAKKRFKMVLRQFVRRDPEHTGVDQISEFTKTFGRFRAGDLVIILQRLHTLASDMAKFNMTEDSIERYKLPKVIKEVRLSNAQQLRILTRVGLAGLAWKMTKPASAIDRWNDERGHNRTEEAYADMLKTISGLMVQHRPMSEAQPFLKAACVYLRISIPAMEENFMRHLAEESFSDSDFIEDADDAALKGLGEKVKHHLIHEGLLRILKLGIEMPKHGVRVERFLYRGYDGIELLGTRANGETRESRRVVVKINIPQNGRSSEELKELFNPLMARTNHDRHFVLHTHEPLEINLLHGRPPDIVEVEEYVEGPTVYELLRTGRYGKISLAQRLDIAIQILETAGALLEGGYVDKEVHALVNYIFTPEGVVKLADFGHIFRIPENVLRDGDAKLARTRKDLKNSLILTVMGILCGASWDKMTFGQFRTMFENRFGKGHKKAAWKIFADILSPAREDVSPLDIPRFKSQLEEVLRDVSGDRPVEFKPAAGSLAGMMIEGEPLALSRKAVEAAEEIIRNARYAPAEGSLEMMGDSLRDLLLEGFDQGLFNDPRLDIVEFFKARDGVELKKLPILIWAKHDKRYNNDARIETMLKVICQSEPQVADDLAKICCAIGICYYKKRSHTGYSRSELFHKLAHEIDVSAHGPDRENLLYHYEWAYALKHCGRESYADTRRELSLVCAVARKRGSGEGAKYLSLLGNIDVDEAAVRISELGRGGTSTLSEESFVERTAAIKELLHPVPSLAGERNIIEDPLTRSLIGKAHILLARLNRFKFDYIARRLPGRTDELPQLAIGIIANVRSGLSNASYAYNKVNRTAEGWQHAADILYLRVAEPSLDILRWWCQEVQSRSLAFRDSIPSLRASLEKIDGTASTLPPDIGPKLQARVIPAMKIVELHEFITERFRSELPACPEPDIENGGQFFASVKDRIKRAISEREEVADFAKSPSPDAAIDGYIDFYRQRLSLDKAGLATVHVLCRVLSAPGKRTPKEIIECGNMLVDGVAETTWLDRARQIADFLNIDIIDSGEEVPPPPPAAPEEKAVIMDVKPDDIALSVGIKLKGKSGYNVVAKIKRLRKELDLLIKWDGKLPGLSWNHVAQCRKPLEDLENNIHGNKAEGTKGYASDVAEYFAASQSRVLKGRELAKWKREKGGTLAKTFKGLRAKLPKLEGLLDNRRHNITAGIRKIIAQKTAERNACEEAVRGIEFQSVHDQLNEVDSILQELESVLDSDSKESYLSCAEFDELIKRLDPELASLKDFGQALATFRPLLEIIEEAENEADLTVASFGGLPYIEDFRSALEDSRQKLFEHAFRGRNIDSLPAAEKNFYERGLSLRTESFAHIRKAGQETLASFDLSAHDSFGALGREEAQQIQAEVEQIIRNDMACLVQDSATNDMMRAILNVNIPYPSEEDTGKAIAALCVNLKNKIYLLFSAKLILSPLGWEGFIRNGRWMNRLSPGVFPQERETEIAETQATAGRIFEEVRLLRPLDERFERSIRLADSELSELTLNAHSMIIGTRQAWREKVADEFAVFNKLVMTWLKDWAADLLSAGEMRRAEESLTLAEGAMRAKAPGIGEDDEGNEVYEGLKHNIGIFSTLLAGVDDQCSFHHLTGKLKAVLTRYFHGPYYQKTFLKGCGLDSQTARFSGMPVFKDGLLKDIEIVAINPSPRDPAVVITRLFESSQGVVPPEAEKAIKEVARIIDREFNRCYVSRKEGCGGIVIDPAHFSELVRWALVHYTYLTEIAPFTPLPQGLPNLRSIKPHDAILDSIPMVTNRLISDRQGIADDEDTRIILAKIEILKAIKRKRALSPEEGAMEKRLSYIADRMPLINERGWFDKEKLRRFLKSVFDLLGRITGEEYQVPEEALSFDTPIPIPIRMSLTMAPGTQTISFIYPPLSEYRGVHFDRKRLSFRVSAQDCGGKAKLFASGLNNSLSYYIKALRGGKELREFVELRSALRRKIGTVDSAVVEGLPVNSLVNIRTSTILNDVKFVEFLLSNMSWGRAPRLILGERTMHDLGHIANEHKLNHILNPYERMVEAEVMQLETDVVFLERIYALNPGLAEDVDRFVHEKVMPEGTKFSAAFNTAKLFTNINKWIMMRRRGELKEMRSAMRVFVIETLRGVTVSPSARLFPNAQEPSRSGERRPLSAAAEAAREHTQLAMLNEALIALARNKDDADALRTVKDVAENSEWKSARTIARMIRRGDLMNARVALDYRGHNREEPLQSNPPIFTPGAVPASAGAVEILNKNLNADLRYVAFDFDNTLIYSPVVLRLMEMAASSDNRQQPTPVIPGIINLLEALDLCQVQYGIATGADPDVKMKQADLHGLGKFFNSARNNIHGLPKRKSEIIAERMAALGLRGDQIALFDDDPLGIQEGKKAGCITVAVARNSDVREELLKENPDIIINGDCTDLADILKALNLDRAYGGKVYADVDEFSRTHDIEIGHGYYNPYVPPRMKDLIDVQICSCKYAIDKLIQMRRWMDDNGAYGKPLIIWQNLTIGGLYPYFTPALAARMGVVEIDEPEIRSYLDNGILPDRAKPARLILVKARVSSSDPARQDDVARMITGFGKKLAVPIIMIDHSNNHCSQAQTYVSGYVSHDGLRLNILDDGEWTNRIPRDIDSPIILLNPNAELDRSYTSPFDASPLGSTKVFCEPWPDQVVMIGNQLRPVHELFLTLWGEANEDLVSQETEPVAPIAEQPDRLLRGGIGNWPDFLRWALDEATTPEALVGEIRDSGGPAIIDVPALMRELKKVETPATVAKAKVIDQAFGTQSAAPQPGAIDGVTGMPRINAEYAGEFIRKFVAAAGGIDLSQPAEDRRKEIIKRFENIRLEQPDLWAQPYLMLDDNDAVLIFKNGPNGIHFGSTVIAYKIKLTNENVARLKGLIPSSGPEVAMREIFLPYAAYADRFDVEERMAIAGRATDHSIHMNYSGSLTMLSGEVDTLKYMVESADGATIDPEMKDLARSFDEKQDFINDVCHNLNAYAELHKYKVLCPDSSGISKSKLEESLEKLRAMLSELENKETVIQRFAAGYPDLKCNNLFRNMKEYLHESIAILQCMVGFINRRNDESIESENCLDVLKKSLAGMRQGINTVKGEDVDIAAPEAHLQIKTSFLEQPVAVNFEIADLDMLKEREVYGNWRALAFLLENVLCGAMRVSNGKAVYIKAGLVVIDGKDYFEVMIRDYGKGIKKGDKFKISDPDYSTKARETGWLFGRRAIFDAGGYVGIDSRTEGDREYKGAREEIGTGTDVVLRWPVKDREVRPVGPVGDGPGPVPGAAAAVQPEQTQTYSSKDRKIGDIRIRLHGLPIDEDVITKIAGYVEVLYSNPLYRGAVNFCATLSDKLGVIIQDRLPGGDVYLLGSRDLGKRRSDLHYPDGWTSIMDYPNHFVTYIRLGNYHIVVDANAQDYTRRGERPVDVEIFVKPSFNELVDTLCLHYGGVVWELSEGSRDLKAKRAEKKSVATSEAPPAAEPRGDRAGFGADSGAQEPAQSTTEAALRAFEERAFEALKADASRLGEINSEALRLYNMMVLPAFSGETIYYIGSGGEYLKAAAHALAEARKFFGDVCAENGWPVDKIGRVVFEICNNAYKRGGGGIVTLRKIYDKTKPIGIEVVALDKGKGIDNVEDTRRRSFSREALLGGWGRGMRIVTKSVFAKEGEIVYETGDGKGCNTFIYDSRKDEFVMTKGEADIKQGTRARLTLIASGPAAVAAEAALEGKAGFGSDSGAQEPEPSAPRPKPAASQEGFTSGNVPDTTDASVLTDEQIISIFSGQKEIKCTEIPTVGGVASVYIVSIPEENVRFKFIFKRHGSTGSGSMMVVKIDPDEKELGAAREFEWPPRDKTSRERKIAEQIESLIEAGVARSSVAEPEPDVPGDSGAARSDSGAQEPGPSAPRPNPSAVALDRVLKRLAGRNPDEVKAIFSYIAQIYDLFKDGDKNILSRTRPLQGPRYVFMPRPRALREIKSDADRIGAIGSARKSLENAWEAAEDVLRANGFTNVNVAFYDGTLVDLKTAIAATSEKKGTVTPKNGLAYVDKKELVGLDRDTRKQLGVTFVKENVPEGGGRFSVGGHVVLALGVLDLINNDRTTDPDYWQSVLDLVRKISNNENKYKGIAKEDFLDKINKEELELDLPPIDKEPIDKDMNAVSITEREVGSAL